MTTQAQILEELQALSRGWGIVGPDLPESLGPGLASLAAIQRSDDITTVRSKVTELLEARVRQLPGPLELCVRTALALPPAPPKRFLTDRLDWLAARVDRNLRTVQRRVTGGLTLLAGELCTQDRTGTSRYAPDGWRVEALDSTLWMTNDPPVVSEHRRIVATRDGLDRIKIGFSAPIPADGVPSPQVRLTTGGTFQPDPELSTTSYLTGWLVLPEPLAAGQHHEYDLVVSGPPRDEMRPYYVFTPLWPCDSFTLCAIFSREMRPRELWGLDGVPSRRIDDFTPSTQPLVPDSRGRVDVSFEHLQVGLSYGIQWRW